MFVQVDDYLATADNWNRMYRRPKFLELLLEIRREMAHEADYDVDLFVEMARHGGHSGEGKKLANGETASTAPAVSVPGPHASQTRNN